MDMGYIYYKLKKTLEKMTQKELLENLTGEKMPEPTPQEHYREQLPNTPFWIIGNETNGYNIIMGKYKFTKEPIFKGVNHTNEDLVKLIHNHLNTFKWDYILSMAICVVTDMLNNQNKQ